MQVQGCIVNKQPCPLVLFWNPDRNCICTAFYNNELWQQHTKPQNAGGKSDSIISLLFSFYYSDPASAYCVLYIQSALLGVNLLLNPIPTVCCHVILIYGMIQPSAGRNRDNRMQVQLCMVITPLRFEILIDALTLWPCILMLWTIFCSTSNPRPGGVS